MSTEIPSIRFTNPPTLHKPTGYSHVAEVSGRLAYIAGQVAIDPAGNLVGPGDIAQQTRQVFDNLKAALEAVGAGFDSVVKLNYYVVDAASAPAVREIRNQYLNADNPPASTFVEIRRLVRDEFLIEVEAIAAIPA